MKRMLMNLKSANFDLKKVITEDKVRIAKLEQQNK